MKRILLPLFLLLAACATASDKPIGKVTVSNRTWGHFQEYLATIGSNQPGAFAIDRSGSGSYYIWCAELQCAGGPTYKRDALKGCERDGSDCVIFAFGRDILVDYEVEKDSAPVASAPAAPVPHVPSKLRISTALRTQVEQYLANSESANENYRFLALNAEGDKLGLSTSCKIRQSGWGGWTAEGCSNETKASQIALDACGDDCRLIFDGGRKLGDFEIEWY